MHHRASAARRRRSRASAWARTPWGAALMTVSIISSGEGSVGVSARPALPTTISTSGKRRSMASRALRSSAASATDARGTVTGMSRMLPSSSAGHVFDADLGEVVGRQAQGRQADESDRICHRQPTVRITVTAIVSGHDDQGSPCANEPNTASQRETAPPRRSTARRTTT